MDWLRGKKLQKGPQPIPPIFHMIWLGGDEMPRIYNDYIRSWALTYTDCKFMLWHDKNIPSELVTGDFIYKIDSVVCRADILRYEIIYRYGGVYIDMDFLSIHRMPPSVFSGTFFGCESPSVISIGILGSYRQNPLFVEILKAIPPNIEENGYDNPNISKLSGPLFLTNLSKTKPYAFKDVKYYDSHHFYKYTFQDKAAGKPFIFEKYAPDITIYGIHMWGNSWDQNYVKTKRVGDFPLSVLFMKESDTGMSYNVEYSEPCEITAPVHKKSIVIFCPTIFTGGIERQISTIVNDTNFMPEHDIYVLAPGINKHVYPLKNSRTRLFLYSSHEMSNRLILDIRPDVILDNTMIYYEPAQISKRYMGIDMSKVIVVIHTSTLYSKNVSPYNIQNIVHLYDDDSMHISFYDIPNSRTIPNGCMEMNNPDSMKISVIGRIANDKIDPAGLKVLGSMPSNIHFYGDVNPEFDVSNFPKNCIIHSHQNIWNILRNTDVIIFMCAETCPYVGIESMSMKKYIIAKNCKGMLKMLEHYGRGFIFRSFEELPSILDEINYKMGNVPEDIKKLYSYLEYRKNITSFITDTILSK